MHRFLEKGIPPPPVLLDEVDLGKEHFPDPEKWIRTVARKDPEYFEAIMKDITEMGDANTDKYFINFSDGDPYFETTGFTYCGQKADTHVRSQVKKMKAAGVKVLSYYIDGTSLNEEQRRSFDYKYGKDTTAYVSVTDIVPLTKTLNKKFIEA